MACSRTGAGRFDSAAKPRLVFNPDRLASGAYTVPLYPQESLLLVALMFRHRVSTDEAGDILWPSAAHMPDAWHDCIGVLISKLRRKLQLVGWTVATHYGFGWRLERHGTADDRGAEETRAAA